jgi:hypothetical protein
MHLTAAAAALALLALLPLVASDGTGSCDVKQGSDGSLIVPDSCIVAQHGNSSAEGDLVTKVQEAKGQGSNGVTYIYTGYVRASDAMRHGNGTCTFSTGDRYEGEWKDGKMNGRGKYMYKNGEEYEGEFLNDQMSGFGRYVWPNGNGTNVYEGEWKNSKQNGRGKFLWPDGQVYEGEFKDGTSNGSGRMSFADGSVFEGQFKDGQCAAFVSQSSLVTISQDVWPRQDDLSKWRGGDGGAECAGVDLSVGRHSHYAVSTFPLGEIEAALFISGTRFFA